jgi:hypothetical protein
MHRRNVSVKMGTTTLTQTSQMKLPVRSAMLTALPETLEETVLDLLVRWLILSSVVQPQRPVGVSMGSMTAYQVIQQLPDLTATQTVRLVTPAATLPDLRARIRQTLR